jgi:hypothetical protein
MLFSINLKINNLSSGSKHFHTPTDSFNIYNLTFLFPWLCDEGFDYSTCLHFPCIYAHRSITIIIIIIGTSALGGPWSSQTNVASELYPGQQPSNFYNQFSLRLPLSILISIETHIAQYFRPSN